MECIHITMRRDDSDGATITATAAIDNDCPIHTMLRNENIFSTGHDVMTFGYGESNRGVKYLFVMDGWYDYGRFVYFDYYPIVKGIKVWVGEDS